ncbi:MAG TPA: aspartate carbamoyltransferase [Spirochaetota bacterium]|nr:aspartate carbamoyltransferase [Spirochaetota bacterium]
MNLHHVIESQQFSRDDLDGLFKLAGEMETLSGGHSALLSGKTLITLFYEPSTRTRLSFEAAMVKLGGSVISTENAANFSSAAKGETLEDTIRVVNGYGDVIVIRHYESGAAKLASSVSSVPVINAGDGTGQHPTQSLLDLYTIKKELGKIDGVSIAMVGDLANGRTVRSLTYLLGKYKDIRVVFVSPPNVKMRDDIKEYCDRHSIKWEECDNLEEAARSVDVVYQTRIQRERFASMEEYERTRGIYVVTPDTMKELPAHAIVMHPLPRVDEISYEVDADPRAAYFRQAHNGLFIRMALLASVLDPNKG